MRKLPIALATIAVLSATLPAHAHRGAHDVTFTAANPCFQVCPYWLEAANSDVDGDGTEDVHFQACEAPAPFQEGVHYDDIEIHRIPEGTALIRFELFPAVDWDGFVCEKGDTWDGDGHPNEELATLANNLGENCDNIIGPNNPVPVGCREKGQIAAGRAKIGKTVLFRAYNFLDGASSPGRYTFS